MWALWVLFRKLYLSGEEKQNFQTQNSTVWPAVRDQNNAFDLSSQPFIHLSCVWNVCSLSDCLFLETSYLTIFTNNHFMSSCALLHSGCRLVYSFGRANSTFTWLSRPKRGPLGSLVFRVYLNGLAWVVQFGFATLLLTRVWCRSDAAQLWYERVNKGFWNDYWVTVA